MTSSEYSSTKPASHGTDLRRISLPLDQAGDRTIVRTAFGRMKKILKTMIKLSVAVGVIAVWLWLCVTRDKAADPSGV